jgi:pantoate--beta-alanine ligase
LVESAQAIRDGAEVAAALAPASAALEEAGFGPIDYFALCDPVTLQALDLFDRPARLLAAAKLGTTRLIDNVAVDLS